MLELQMEEIEFDHTASRMMFLFHTLKTPITMINIDLCKLYSNVTALIIHFRIAILLLCRLSFN
jgi:hypothetical protein